MDEGGLLVAGKLLLVTEASAVGCAVFFAVTLLVLRFVERRNCFKIRAARILRRCMLTAYILMCASIGLAVYFMVAFGDLNWIVGATSLSLVWIILFTLRIRCEYLWAKKYHGDLSPSEKSDNVWIVISTDSLTDRSVAGKANSETPTGAVAEVQQYLHSLGTAVQHNRLLYILGVGFILATAFLATASFNCMCVAFQPFEISTSWSRNFSPSICEKSTICNVHVTIADSGYDLIVNFHYTDHFVQPNIYAYVVYDIVSHSSGDINLYNYSSSASSFRMENIREEYRYVNWAELANLNGSTTYYVVAIVHTQAGVVKSQEFKVKSLPNGDDYTFITGGDTSTDDHAIDLMKIASSKYPDFAMVGGDIAYDNGMAACYRRWDIWLSNWRHYMTTPDGHIIPTIYAIGNHEVGGFSVYDGKAPFYTAYFPQQKGLEGVDPHARPQYHAHRIGKSGVAIVLDSDILTHMGGAQTEWLENVLLAARKENRTTIFVMYHGTMYNSGTSPFPTPTITKDGKTHWVPLFDKYNVTVVFENHYHNYKRTKPLRGDKVVPEGEGVVYLGDGAWGVKLNTKEPEVMPWFLEKSLIKSHMFHVQVTPNKIVADATDRNNLIFDTWSKVLL